MLDFKADENFSVEKSKKGTFYGFNIDNAKFETMVSVQCVVQYVVTNS